MPKEYIGHTNALSEITDAELVRLAQEGDKSAFVALYRRYLERVYRYFYARTGNVQLAEDLTAQTFMAVLESLSRYRERGIFVAWLFTIAARRYADACRERIHISLDVEATASRAEQLSDPALPPESAMVQSEQTAALVKAIRSLSPDRAQAVALHFFGGLSHKETAKAMGRSRIAVKSLIHRALRDLRKELKHGQA